MKGSVLITGITGFLGKSFRENFNFRNYKKIYLLARDPSKITFALINENISVVKGDIGDINSYSDILPKVETVIHIAAVTGKAEKSEYFRTNFEFTSVLIDSCIKNSVKYFLFVSSIAAGFQNRAGYHYANSKLKAEKYLEKSGLKYCILRPTMIFGKGSPVFNGFFSLTNMPFIPIFGNGKNMVSPVYVSDVVRVIDFVCNNKTGIPDGIYELGGKETVVLKDLLTDIASHRGLNKKVFKIPLFLITPVIFLADKLLYRFTPVTLGQLATFRNGGAPKKNKMFEKLYENSISLNQMIDESVRYEEEKIEKEKADRECTLFTRYLINGKPTEYVLEKYRQFLSKINNKPLDRFDEFLIKFASLSGIFTKMADSFSKFFYPSSLLRKRLGFLFAILETSPLIYKKIDRIRQSGKFMILIMFSYKICLFFLSLFASVLLLMPAKLILSGKKTDNPKVGNER